MDDERRAFEEWALRYLKTQYSFYEGLAEEAAKIIANGSSSGSWEEWLPEARKIAALFRAHAKDYAAAQPQAHDRQASASELNAPASQGDGCIASAAAPKHNWKDDL